MTPPRFLGAWGKQGSGPGEFQFPIGIAVSDDGEVFVTDVYTARVQRFRADGTYLMTFEVLPNPAGITLGPDGLLYLSHFPNVKLGESPKPDAVSVYDLQGNLCRRWGRVGTGPGELNFPGGLVLSPQGHLYVADQTNRRVQVFTQEGRFLFAWGSYGTSPGQFGGNVPAAQRVGGPQFIARDRAGNLYTTEASVGRIQKFTADGKFVQAWGHNDDSATGFGTGPHGAPGGLHGPIGICLDHREHLWVSAVSGRIVQFTRDGKFLQRLDKGSGSAPYQFQVPHGIGASRDGRLYVVDSSNHRIQCFAV